MEFTKNFKFVLIFLIQILARSTESAKILAIFPFPGPSQYILVQPYLKTLAARGHELTVINAYPQKTTINNFRDVPIMEVLIYNGDVLSYANMKISKFQEILGLSWYYNSIVKDVLNNAGVKKLLKSSEEKFDLVIVETLQTDALYGFAVHFNAPLIGVSSFGTDPYIDSLVNNISPMAYIPLHTGSYTEHMNFRERLENMWHNLLMIVHRELIHKPSHEKLYKEYFPKATKSLEELRNNFSLILLNQHYSLSFPRPYVTNMIEVGGFHMQHKPQNLSKDIELFINSSLEDVIYFCMGSNIKSEHFPLEIRKIFLETFASLPYKILWKFENPDLMPEKPSNVFICNWFPQGDILAHPKVKLFITHGGLLSMIESIYHGKPILAVPVFYDQFVNALRAQQSGFGLSIRYLELNQTILLQTITELLGNISYMEKAKLMSGRYRDQPIDPLEKAIYWTEYVLRHKGADFLRSPAQNLNFVQRNGWDCAAVIIAGFMILLITVVIIFVKLMKCCIRLRKVKKIKKN